MVLYLILALGGAFLLRRAAFFTGTGPSGMGTGWNLSLMVDSFTGRSRK